MEIGFDIISDLHLKTDDTFNWEGKVTSLYCIIAGNVGPDIKTVSSVLTNLSKYYQGVFYIPGSLEYTNADNIELKTKELANVCKKIKNVTMLYQHIVIINGIAIVACNGWYGNTVSVNLETDSLILKHRFEDLYYLKNSIEKLQKHLDVKNIIVVTNSVPKIQLYHGEIPNILNPEISLDLILSADTERKISKWVFGMHNKAVDKKIDYINYINNPCYNQQPYWAKRINAY